ncbi:MULTISPECIES: SH3 domain-containing protein [unclassified Serratia (in: enterobacteria)]|uniref:SH3 domain-containing protein n=1 Tax=unclassified Serratia (in: enterobacteria) TaxID=2647522 RepID=UPI0015F67F71|nr:MULTISPECIES: SH3 domain-containing protein [unclassified Serratia (in: enterobacteria)]
MKEDNNKEVINIADYTIISKNFQNIIGNENIINTLARVSLAANEINRLANHDKTISAISKMAGDVSLINNELSRYVKRNNVFERYFSTMSNVESYSRRMFDLIERFTKNQGYKQISSQINSSIHDEVFDYEKMYESLAKIMPQQSMISYIEAWLKENSFVSTKGADYVPIPKIISDRIEETYSISDVELATYQDELEKLDEVDSESKLILFLDSIPKNLKFYIILVMVYFLAPILRDTTTGVAVNIITEIVQGYLSSESGNDSEKIKKIKSLPLTSIDKSNVRFITKNFVNLRDGPSIKHNVIDELVLGQVVSVVSKNKNWIEVEVKCEDGQAVTGWVFTRYTERFKY